MAGLVKIGITPCCYLVTEKSGCDLIELNSGLPSLEAEGQKWKIYLYIWFLVPEVILLAEKVELLEHFFLASTVTRFYF